jgi:sporulation protein YpjB
LVRIICLIVVCFLFYPSGVYASQEQLDRGSEQWVAYVTIISKEIEAKNYLKARQKLDELAKLFSEANFKGKRLNVQAIQVLSTTMIELEGRLTRITPNQTELTFYAKRLLLAFDAANHPHQPMWLAYYAQVNQQITRMIADVDKNKDIRRQRSQLEQLYVLLRPAIVVSKTPITVQKIDSLFALLSRNEDKEHQLIALSQLQRILFPLFYGSEQDVLAVSDPTGKVEVSTFLMTLSIIVVGLLAFVAFRKRLHFS